MISYSLIFQVNLRIKYLREKRVIVLITKTNENLNNLLLNLNRKSKLNN
jgi:hypothetical protein